MYKVRVQNPCRCFLKNGLSELLEFEDKDKAKDEANKMLKIMKSNFCQQHEFVQSEEFGDFTIFIKPREK